jgi:hypothetical protein
MPVYKTYREVTIPLKVQSAHKPIIFKYDMPTEAGQLQATNGVLQITAGTFMNNSTLLKVGDLIYVTSGQFKGYHTIRSVVHTLIGYIITTNTTTSAFTTYITDVKYATPPVWSIFKGYRSNEGAGFAVYPYAKISDFQAEPNSEGFLEFNVSGYVQAAMQEITEPLQGTNIGFGIFNYEEYLMPYRIVINNSFTRMLYAVNSGLETIDLFNTYLDGSTVMAENFFWNTCGATFTTVLSGNKLYHYRREQTSTGTTFPRRSFDDGFSSGFFKT